MAWQYGMVHQMLMPHMCNVRQYSLVDPNTMFLALHAALLLLLCTGVHMPA
jgi:hypothetical protein